VTLILLCLAGPAFSTTVGSIQVKNYGEVFVVAPDWSVGAVSLGSTGFTMTGNGRVHLATRAEDGWEQDMFWKTPLLGATFSYTVDLSNVGCHCNANTYFVGMPGPPGDFNDYYCDSFGTGGNPCPEYDTMEGNKYTLASTLHSCDGADGDWTHCDWDGCRANAYDVDSSMMCPDEGCTINTNLPFKISHFQSSEEVTTTLEQEGREASFAVCTNPGYLDEMAPVYDSLVFTATQWGGAGIDMGWLDGMTGCQGECNLDISSISFSNFELSSKN